MSIENLHAEIAVKLLEFDVLNQGRFDGGNYEARPAFVEKAIVELAEEISRLQMTKSVMAANAIMKEIDAAVH